MLTVRHYRLAVIGAAAVLGVAACGDDDEETARDTDTQTAPPRTTPAPKPSEGAASTVEVDLAKEFKLDPENGSADKPGKVAFELKNTDTESVHALEIEGQGVEQRSPDIEVGNSATFTVDLKAGEYEWYCPVDGHKDLGMKGTLTVGSG